LFLISFLFFLPLAIRSKTLGKNNFSTITGVHGVVEARGKSASRNIATISDILDNTISGRVGRPNTGSLLVVNVKEDVLSVVADGASNRLAVGEGGSEVRAVHLDTPDARAVLLRDLDATVVTDELGGGSDLLLAAGHALLDGGNAVAGGSEVASLRLGVAGVADGARTRNIFAEALPGSVAGSSEASALSALDDGSRDVVFDGGAAPAAFGV